MEAIIDYATDDDLPMLASSYRRASGDVLRRKIQSREVVIARVDTSLVGWLTFTLLYDVVPFINEICVVNGHRRQGIGTRLVEFLLAEVEKSAATAVMTSSMSNEEGQHFWRRMGFKDAGGVLLAEEPLELFFRRDMGAQ